MGGDGGEHKNETYIMYQLPSLDGTFTAIYSAMLAIVSLALCKHNNLQSSSSLSLVWPSSKVLADH